MRRRAVDLDEEGDAAGDAEDAEDAGRLNRVAHCASASSRRGFGEHHVHPAGAGGRNRGRARNCIARAFAEEHRGWIHGARTILGGQPCTERGCRRTEERVREKGERRARASRWLGPLLRCRFDLALVPPRFGATPRAFDEHSGKATPPAQPTPPGAASRTAPALAAAEPKPVPPPPPFHALRSARARTSAPRRPRPLRRGRRRPRRRARSAQPPTTTTTTTTTTSPKPPTAAIAPKPPTATPQRRRSPPLPSCRDRRRLHRPRALQPSRRRLLRRLRLHRPRLHRPRLHRLRLHRPRLRHGYREAADDHDGEQRRQGAADAEAPRPSCRRAQGCDRR